MNVIFYSKHGCPKCKVLETKLKQKAILFEEVNDINVMKEKGFMSAPVLEVDGAVYDFKSAVEWVKEQ